MITVSSFPLRLRFRTSWFFLASLLFCPAALQAQKVKLAIVPRKEASNIDASYSAWIQRLLRFSIRQRPKLDLLEENETRERLSASRALSSQDKMTLALYDRYLKKAREIYKKMGRCDYTLKALDVSRKLALKVQMWIRDPESVAEMHRLYAACYLKTGQAVETRTALVNAIRYNPEFVPDEDAYPAQFVQYYRVLREWLMKNAKYEIRLDSVPSGASVYFNLRLVGKTPVTVSNIFPARHQFRMEHDGYEVWETIANFDPKKLKQTTIRTSINLKRDPKSLSLDGIPIFAQGASVDPIILDRLESMREKLEAKQLFVLEPERSSTGTILLKIAIFRQGDRQISYETLDLGTERPNHRTVLLGYAQKLEEKLSPTPVSSAEKPPDVRTERPPPPRRRDVAVVLPPIRREEPIAPPRRPDPPPDEKRTPFYATWWFWTIIGGAAAATATVIVVLSIPPPPPSATFIVTTSP